MEIEAGTDQEQEEIRTGVPREDPGNGNIGGNNQVPREDSGNGNIGGNNQVPREDSGNGNIGGNNHRRRNRK